MAALWISMPWPFALVAAFRVKSLHVHQPSADPLQLLALSSCYHVLLQKLQHFGAA